ncbi:MAG: ABC-type sugar transport system periplasmic component-like protein [Rhodoglobus sp.]|nr:ABC-type sugar transport system periplasmic component-like protein [Rhodoglobus sp.]
MLNKMWGVTALVLTGTILAGCSSGTSTPAVSVSAGPANLAAAQALLDEYTKVPAFTSPGPAFDAAAAGAGKTIFALPSNSSISFVEQTTTALEEIAKEVGVGVQTYPNQGQTSQWGQGIDTAISTKADLLQLVNGVDPDLVTPQLKNVAAAGIPIVDTHDLDFGQAHNSVVDAFVDGDFVTAGKLIAAWAITATKGKANVLILTSNNYKNSFPVADGMRAEFAADCPSCIQKEVNVNGPDWATKLQSTVQTSLTADPGINYILPTFDGMLTYVIPGIRSAGAVGKVFAASYNGSPDMLDLVRDNGIVRMIVGENPAQIAAAGLDQSLRILAGLEPSADEHLVLRAFTADNVAEAGTPAKLGQGYGDAWHAGYLTTWELG